MHFNKILNSTIICLGLIALLALTNSCNDPSKVGSELIGQDGFEVVFNDTASLNAKIIEGNDSIQTNGENFITSDLFLGELDDPFFGTKKFDAYFQTSIGSVAPFFFDRKNEEFATIDSIVLILRIDTTFFYGDLGTSHEVQVFQIDEELDEDMELYIEDDLDLKMDPISPIQTITPRFENFEERFNGDSSITGPAIRVVLNNDFGQMIIDDSTAVKKDSSFLALINGMMITSTPNNSGVISLDLAVTQLSDVGNKMLLYYQDTMPKVYSFPIGGLRHHQVIKDITGSTLESAIDNVTFSDSIMMIEGFGVSEVEIELPNVNFDNYGNILVKKAELEVTVADLDGDEDIFDPIQLLGIQVLDENGEKVLIRDAVLAETAGQLSNYFGGNLKEELDENDMVIRRYYTFNITSYFIDLIQQNTIESNKIYLGALVPRLTPGRGTLFGPGHSTYPMKLNLTYTVPN